MKELHSSLALVIGFLGLVVLVAPGCQRQGLRGDASQSGDYMTAIHDVLSIDSELGIVRNEATRTRSLATAIGDYVASIDTVDFSGCPADFTEAFRAHRNAWEESIRFFERFPDLRGEMHELFEEIRSQSIELRDDLERTEVPIWDTWSEVEAVAADYGAIEPQLDE